MRNIMKKVIIIVLAVSLVIGGVAGSLSYMKKKNQKDVMVVNVGSIASNYYMPSTTLQGQIATSVSQNIKIDKDIIVQDVYVQKGDTVKKGDKLISFDMTLVEMELNIAKLKNKKLEQDLNKSVNRLNSLLNGGPVEETDQNPIDADNLGGDKNTTDDMEPVGEQALRTDRNGMYVATAVSFPIMATILDAGETFEEDSSQSETIPQEQAPVLNEEDSLSSGNEHTETQGSIQSGDVIYDESGTGDLSSGEEEPSDPNLTPQPGEPTPTPDVLDPSKVNGLSDGEAPFYMTLDYDTEPFTGTGTKEDPYVFLCSSAKGKVKVLGSFFNKMAGYSQDGTEKLSQSGSWFQLEFHQADTVSDFQDRKQSCIGYYYIDGSLLSKPVYMFAETELTLEEASHYEEDNQGGDDGDPGDGGSPQVTISREEAIKIQKKRIASLKLDLQTSNLNITKLEKKMNNQEIYSKLDGTVAYVGDPVTGKSTQDAFLKVKSKEGYYVRGQVSELLLDKVKEGTILTCSSYDSGEFDAEVMDVSEYPVSGDGNYMGEGNPNVSYYNFTASIPDKTVQVGEDSWLNIMLNEDVTDTNLIIISKAFVRTEDGKSYVYKAENGILKKQPVTLGASVDGGYNIMIKDGISREDYIAFPYGDAVKEGAKTKEGTLEEMYGF